MSKSAIELDDGYYVLQLKDAEVKLLKTDASSLQHVQRQLQNVSKMSKVEMIDLIARLKRHSIQEATGESSAGKAIAAGSGALAPAENRAFLDRLKKAEMNRHVQLEQSGQLLDSHTLASLMGVTRQAISKAEASLRMFSLDGGAGKKLYPAFFADSHIDRRTIQKVSRMLDRLAGSSKWQFFTSPRLSLGKKTPIEALRRGKVDQVMAAALAFREA